MYKANFQELIKLANREDLYVGMGNPNSNILIVGKEIALDKDSQNPVIEKTVLKNAEDWMININNPNMSIENCEDNSKIEKFNPLCPYKGMKKQQQKPGATWRKYQLLYENLTACKSDEYTYNNGAFITEMNQIPSKYSAQQDKQLRAESIKKRESLFLASDFIQDFPIVIVACGHYPKENGVDLCKIFNVDFSGPVHADNDPKQWYNLHFSKKGDKPKVLIHTRQLSSSVSGKLIEMIADEIGRFCRDNKIKI
jgi:hypothetical protein